MINIKSITNKLSIAYRYWKDLLEQYGVDTGIVIMCGANRDVYDIVIQMIPALRMQKKYHDIVIVSDKKEDIEYIRLKLRNHALYRVCSSDMIMQFCHLQALMYPLNDIYITQTRIIDDSDSFRLVGYGGLDLWFVVAKVILDLKSVPQKADYVGDVINVIFANDMLISGSDIEQVNWGAYAEYTNLDFGDYSTHEDFWDNRLNMLITNRHISSDKHIVLYGRTRCTLYYIERMKHYDNVIVVDRNMEKQGRINERVEIKSPEEVLAEYDEKKIILITLFHYKEVCEWLFSLGYEIGKHIFLVNAPYNALSRSSEHLKAKIFQKVKNGKEAYDRLREKYKDEMILLSPWNASGDIYIDCLYLSDFISENGLTKYQIVLSNPGAKNIATLFGFESELISEEDMFAILDLARAIGFDQLNLMNINVNVGGQRIGRLDRDVDFNTLHQRLVFHSEMRKTIPDIHQDNSDTYFEYYHLKKGKTALLAPYTRTFGRIEEEVCLEIVNMLKAMGYSVCTNTGPGEEAIPGTTGVLIPYDCIIDFVNKCGLFIGMRSGLCDIISSTSAKMVVFHKESHFTFFSMKGMGIKTENILELKREDVSKYNVVETIKDFCDV